MVIKMAKDNEATTETQTKPVKFVKMVNDDGVEADVHPDEIHNYAKGGYIKADKQ